MESWRRRVNENLDEKSEEFLMKTFYYLLQISGVFSYARGKWFYVSIVQNLILFTTILLPLMQLVYTTILIRDDLTVAAQTFHLAAGDTVCILILWLIPLNRHVVIEGANILSCGVYDYGESLDRKQIEIWTQEMIAFKDKLFKRFPIFLFVITFEVAIIGPMLDKLQGLEFDEDYINGVFMKAPVPLWFPFHVNAIFVQIYELVVVAVLLAVLCAACFCIFYFTHEINVQLRILIYSIENLEIRALFMVKKNYPNFPRFKTRFELYKDTKFMHEYSNCLKQNLEHHLIIMRMQKLMDHVQRWIMFDAVFFISIVFACSLFIVSKGERKISPQLFSLLLLIMEFIIIIIISHRGQELIDLSEDLHRAFFIRTKWIHCSESVKKTMIIATEMTKRTLHYRVGGLTPINWDMFGSIVNTAYSYFNLLIAMKEET